MTGADLPQREPITDLEYIVGYAVEVQRPSRVTTCPELFEHIAAFLNARRWACTAEPVIGTEMVARATLQAHRHHVGAPCLQKRAALGWLSANGLIVRSSGYDRAE
jgi:hypothetical protein